MSEPTEETVRQRVREMLRRHVGQKGALLSALLDVQYELGYVPESAVEDTSEILGCSQPEVWGVLTFYADFKVGKKAEHFVDVCVDAPCHVEGAQRIWKALEASLAEEKGARPRFELRRVSCPRLCAQAPAVALDRRWVGRMTPERAAALVQAWPDPAVPHPL